MRSLVSSGYISTAELHYEQYSPTKPPPDTRHDIRSNQHNSATTQSTDLTHNIPGTARQKEKKKRERRTTKTDNIFPTNRLPRPRRPPPRSLLRQARGPACCCHGSGLKLLLVSINIDTTGKKGKENHMYSKGFRVQGKANEMFLKPYMRCSVHVMRVTNGIRQGWIAL
jgi:hypothetical protein